MQTIKSLEDLDNLNILFDERWTHEKTGLSMHSLHAYPAKFPSFIASEAFEYAKEEGVNVSSAADMFCGCGTTALEAKVRGINFWGCDINPVAVLITLAKTGDYCLESIEQHFKDIIALFDSGKLSEDNAYSIANERLKYWFDKDCYIQLSTLNNCIYTVIGSDYKNEFLFFQCIFSSILKTCSKWLQKSIKPQIDPSKHATNVIKEFTYKYKLAYTAVKQMIDKEYPYPKQITIVQGNFLEYREVPNVDLIITSPPYVTSYEYADLHQLSSLWLKYTDDYKELRKGTIGSRHISKETDIGTLKLNNTAIGIIDSLTKKGCKSSQKKPVAMYYSDMQKVVKKSYEMLNKNGMIVFVIGDSELMGVKLQNSRHLIESMILEGFHNIKISKREVSKGICVPYRDAKGKFTYQSNARNEIYHEEYIISGRKH